jgi:hypothetical protein
MPQAFDFQITNDVRPDVYKRPRPYLNVPVVTDVIHGLQPGLKKAVPSYPDGCCTWASNIVVRVLLGAQIGAVSLSVRPGRYDGRPHTWILASDGTIIDPTLGQFVGGDALHIVTRDDDRYSKYVEDLRPRPMGVF